MLSQILHLETPMATHRRVLLALIIVVCLLRASTVQAQLSAYVTPMFTGWGYSTSGSNNLVLSKGSGGLGGGLFYDFPIQSRLTVGIDLRGSDSFGTNGGDAFSAAFRFAFVPHKVRLRPFIQIGGGVVSAAPYTQYTETCSPTCTLTTASKRATNGAAIIDFGLDIRLTHSFDLRAFDYGAEAGGNGTDTDPASGFAFFSTGVVYHLHPRP